MVVRYLCTSNYRYLTSGYSEINIIVDSHGHTRNSIIKIVVHYNFEKNINLFLFVSVYSLQLKCILRNALLTINSFNKIILGVFLLFFIISLLFVTFVHG